MRDDQLTMAVRTIVRERDDAARSRDKHPEWPTWRERGAGEVHGYNMALAILAGYQGYLSRQALEAWAQPAAAAPEPGPDEPTDEPSDEPAAPSGEEAWRRGWSDADVRATIGSPRGHAHPMTATEARALDGDR